MYREKLNDCDGIKFFEADLNKIIPHIQPIVVMNGKRDELRKYLDAQGIQTGIHYKPNHLGAALLRRP
jgi:dTDP-4-amino-4,6-dideoxygalactose transaminase